jgi:hypothetical protein
MVVGKNMEIGFDTMKQAIIGFVLGASIFGTAAAYAAGGGKNIEVFYNINDIKIDKVSNMPHQDPFIYMSTAYVPLRFVSEELGAEVRWDGKNRVIHIGEMENPTPAYFGREVDSINREVAEDGELRYVFNERHVPINDSTGEMQRHFLLSTLGGAPGETNSHFIEFPLGDDYEYFHASFGNLENHSNPMNTQKVVEIHLDDQKAAEYSITAEDAPETIKLELNGAEKISFHFKLAGEGDQSASSYEAALFNPFFTRK